MVSLHSSNIHSTGNHHTHSPCSCCELEGSAFALDFTGFLGTEENRLLFALDVVGEDGGDGEDSEDGEVD